MVGKELPARSGNFDRAFPLSSYAAERSRVPSGELVALGLLARHLRLPSIMLRLKGEADDEAVREHPAFADEQLVDVEEVDDGEIDDRAADDRFHLLGDPRGLGIAAATFVPTFLVIFLGLPYLVGPAFTARTPREPSAVATAPPIPTPDSSGSPGSSLSEALRAGSADSRVTAPPAAPAPPPAESSRVPEALPPVAEDAGPQDRERAPEPAPSTPPPTVSSAESSASPTVPTLPSAPSRVPEPERKTAPSRTVLEPRAAPGPRPAAATPDPPRPRRPPGDWTPAAAFADRAGAARLASSIERQGYPVEIRQDSSSTRPWVVWIGSQPSGGARRR